MKTIAGETLVGGTYEYVLMSENFDHTVRPVSNKDFEKLAKSNNEKYGDFDSNTRRIDKSFVETFSGLLGDFDSVIICGANKGEEVAIVKDINPRAAITALDISNAALEKLKATKGLESVDCLHEDLEKISAKDKRFDLYVALRTIPSSNVDMAKALQEAMRITRKRIVLSVSNGYVMNGEIVNGMYEYDTKKIDTALPFEIRDNLSRHLAINGWNVSLSRSEGDLFITATVD